MLLSDLLQTVCSKVSRRGTELSANSIRTSRDRIQYYDKKDNNIENKQMPERCVTTIVELWPMISFVLIVLRRQFFAK